MSRVPIRIKHVVSFCFHLPQRFILKRTTPHTALLVGTVMDLVRGKLNWWPRMHSYFGTDNPGSQDNGILQFQSTLITIQAALNSSHYL